MKRSLLMWAAVFYAACAGHAHADIHYVDAANVSSVIPYTNGWASAATGIQDAVDSAADADTVLVTNGTYQIACQISVTNSIMLKSVNGARVTTIEGTNPFRCILVDNCNATVENCTLTDNQSADYNGQGGGGGS